jgi:hypothetical protein
VERVVVPQLVHGHRLDDRTQQEPAHQLFVTDQSFLPKRVEGEP